MAAAKIRFAHPPVTEVVCGAIFQNLDGLLAPHLGLLWGSIRDQYPFAREAAPLDPVVETFGEGLSPLQLQVVDRPPLPRVWLLASDERELIQIQRDRFHFNLKRPDGVGDYPEFEYIFKRFENELTRFETFLQTEQLGALQIRQFELTYSNFIGPENGLGELEAGSGILVDHVRETTRERFLPLPEQYAWRTAYLMPDQQGRLHITAARAMRRSDGRRMMKLELTARGLPKAGAAAMHDWFGLAHEWVVRGFVDVTSEQIQRDVWGRTA